MNKTKLTRSEENNMKEQHKEIKQTFSPTCELISTTFWLANPPYFTAFSVALLAIFVADDDKNDQPYTFKIIKK